MTLVDYVDEFVVCDSFPYSRQSHQNRAPIRTPDGRMWLSLPLERTSRGRRLDEVALTQERFWPGKHWRALVHNYSSTAFFQHYADELEALLRRPYTSLADLTVETTLWLAKTLGITTKVRRLGPGGGASLREVAEVVGGRYVALEDTAAHDAAVLNVDEVMSFSGEAYAQNFDGFEVDLSVLDLLFTWGPEAVGMLRARRQIMSPHQAGVKLARPPGVC